MLDLLTEREVSRQLHVSLASLRRWRLLQCAPRFLKVGSLVRYRPEDLEAWLAGQPTGGASPQAEKPSWQLVGRRRSHPVRRTDGASTVIESALPPSASTARTRYHNPPG